MKKIVYSIVALGILSFSAQSEEIAPIANPSPNVSVLAPQTSVTDIFNFLKSNLNLTQTQQPAVQDAVNVAGGKYLDLFKKASPGIQKEAEKVVFDEFTKKLGVGGLLSGAQSSKLSTLSPTLMSMFSQLK